MSQFWWILLLVGLGSSGAIAPALPVTAEVSTQEPSGSNRVDSAFPDSIGAAVLEVASGDIKQPLDQLTLTRAMPRIWSDGCLGLAPPGQMCTAVLVRGWEVKVAHQRQEWVYRTCATGQKIVLDLAGSRLSPFIAPPAEQIAADQRPIKVDRSVVFREIRSGGFAGMTQETRLYKDGRLVKLPVTGASQSKEGEVMRRVPKAELKAFQNWLEAHHFGQFDGLRYPAPKGAADYFTLTLGNGQTTVQYTDISQELPADLVQVEQAWRSLVAVPK